MKKTFLAARPSSAISSDAAPSWPIKVIFQLRLRWSASPLQLTPSAFKPRTHNKFSFITILYSPDSPSTSSEMLKPTTSLSSGSCLTYLLPALS